MPHITVRYSSIGVADYATALYERVAADRVNLASPGSFDRAASDRSEISTLFVKCRSRQLELLSYKPDFPDSIFHLTIYDGEPSELASAIYDVLREFPWNLDVRLPPTRVTRARRRPAASTQLSKDARSLLKKLGYSPAADFSNVSVPDRLALARSVCEVLHERLPTAEAIRSPRVHESRPTDLTLQGEFWPVHELLDRTYTGPPLGTEHHRQTGLFLTPPEISYDVAVAAASWLPEDSSIDLGDPAIGSGIFLASLLSVVDPVRIKSAIGVESDRARADLTADRWSDADLQVEVGDFVDYALTSSPIDSGQRRDPNLATGTKWSLAPDRTLILANPPYVRSQLLDPGRSNTWREHLHELTGIRLSHRADLYAYFILAAHQWMAPGALALWLVPTEFMFTNYGNAVRDYLTSQVSIRQVHSYDGPSKFSNARVTSCVVVLENRSPQARDRVKFTAGGTIQDPFVGTTVSVRELRKLEKWHTLADSTFSAQVDESSFPTIGDLFEVRRGVATGANQFFVLDSEAVQVLGIPSKWRKPIVPRARNLASQVIPDSFGLSKSDATVRWLIDCDQPLDAIEAEAADFATYLRDIESEVVRRTLVQRRHPFYKQEKSVPARYLFSYMAKDSPDVRRFFLNRSRAVALNNYLCLYPKPHLSAWLTESPNHETDLLGLLSSITPSTLARLGRTYVEGLTKVEPSELRRMPISNLPFGLNH